MPSFTFTDEQKMLVDAIKDYAESLRDAAHDADETSTLPANLVQKGWDLGLLPASLPEEYGGLGEYSTVTNALAAEAFAYGDLSIALAVMAPALVGLPVLLSGTPEQKAKYLPALAEPAAPPYTAALLEPCIAFKADELKTTVTHHGDQYVLNGQKCYVPFAANAQTMLVYARDTESGKADGYLVEAGTNGLQIDQREKLMGVRALPTYQVALNNVAVPVDAKLGGERGTYYERLLSHSRLGLAAMAVGVANAAYDYAREYAKTRVQFGAPIATKQAIAFMLAEMAIEVDAARLLVWEAAWKLDSDPDVNATTESYLAREYANKMVLYVTDSAVQALGGHGYIREHPVERWLRNARGFAIFDGLAMI